MVLNKKTNGFLAFDMGDKITSHDEAYATTTSNKASDPQSRNVFVVTRVDEEDGHEDDTIRYGQQVRFEATPYIHSRKLYLHSQPLSPTFYARFSRNQEVCMHIKKIFNTVWTIEHPDPNQRFEAQGLPIQANSPVVIKHSSTCHFLASDEIEYRNDFGMEYEVCVHSYATKNKSQNLALENEGKITSDVPTKFQFDQNVFMLVTSTDPGAAAPVDGANEYTIDNLIKEIKQKILERGSYGIRGIARTFKLMDDNGNRQLEVDDFRWGLKDYGIDINQDEAAEIVTRFDKDKSGTLDFNEFLVWLKGDINEEREKFIFKAYQKLDVNKDGMVTLEDIAKIYDASHHPDVISQKMTQEQVFKEFMSQWDTQVADGIVSFDEFMEYYRDVSASIDRDDYFEVMMTNAWKLDK